MKKFIYGGILVAALIAIGIYLSIQDSKPLESNDFSRVPTSSELLNNMAKAGLEPLKEEGQVLHIHQHLEMVINGKPITVPANLGVGFAYISPFHTHDATGILHVEAPEIKDFKIGQFFDQWGVDLNDNCVGTYCADENNKLVVGVNGQPITNVRDYVVKQHDKIYIWYGSKSEAVTIPAEYSFPEGL